jgi:Flp pilus assembly protein TadG
MNIRRHIAHLRGEESGFALVMVAMMVTVLVAMAAFAVDFGWLYWNGIKIQHGADAAALSGVVYEPNDQAAAYSEARNAAAENGYRTSDPGTTVTPVDFSDDATAVHNPNQLKVSVTDTVPTFFMAVFGVENVAITKHAIAEYVLPLAMGSDEPYFGTDPDLGNAPNFWANIHGYKAATQWGDR